MPSPNESGPRLLYVATSKNQGGLERYSVRLARLLRERGQAVQYACLPGEIIDDLCREAGVPALPLTTRNSGDLRAARTLAAQIGANRIDLVHVHSRRDYVPAVLAVALARRRRGRGRSPRLVFHAHLVRPLGTPPRLSRAFFQWGADAVLAVSGAVRAKIQQEHGFPPGFVRLLYNGVDVAEFAQPGEARAQEWRRDRRAEWGLPPDALVIGMVGRLDAKGQASLLDALPSLMPRFPNLHVALVGPDGSPGEAERLAARAREAGIGDRVVFPGLRRNIPQVLPAFDLLAHLPADDALPGALIEAMAAGLPTVATDIPGCAEIVRHEETGLLVPLDDAPALVAAVTRLLEMSQEDRQRMGATGRQRAEDSFDLSGQIGRLQEIYEELCPRPL